MYRRDRLVKKEIVQPRQVYISFALPYLWIM